MSVGKSMNPMVIGAKDPKRTLATRTASTTKPMPVKRTTWGESFQLAQRLAQIERVCRRVSIGVWKSGVSVIYVGEANVHTLILPTSLRRENFNTGGSASAATSAMYGAMIEPAENPHFTQSPASGNFLQSHPPRNRYRFHDLARIRASFGECT